MAYEHWPRAILHMDMDAFFASVEIRDNPELRDRPIAVGGVGPRGVISTASYAARAFGVHSAMATARALSLCPDLIVLPGRHGHYSQISRQIMGVLDSFSPLRETVSVDEAYLDITGSQRLLGSPRDIAVAIRQAVWDEVRLTCSVGVGSSKSVAKIASGYNKPHGITVVEPQRTREFLAPLPISAIGGVGPVAQKKFANLGVVTVGDLAQLPLSVLQRAVGAGAGHLRAIALGEDSRAVGVAPKDRSIGKERTFSVDIADKDQLRLIARNLADDVSHRLRSKGMAARTVSVKVKAGDGRIITRSIAFHSPCQGSEEFRERALIAANRALDDVTRVRLLGVRAEHVVPQESVTMQGDLAGHTAKWDQIDRAMDQALDKFGYGSLGRATSLRAPVHKDQNLGKNGLTPK